MHKLYPLVLLLLFVCGAAAREQAILARVTVYWHSPGSKERIAASGPLLHDEVIARSTVQNPLRQQNRAAR